MKKRLLFVVVCMFTICIHAQQFVINTNDRITMQKSTKEVSIQQQTTPSRRALAENQYADIRAVCEVPGRRFR